MIILMIPTLNCFFTETSIKENVIDIIRRNYSFIRSDDANGLFNCSFMAELENNKTKCIIATHHYSEKYYPEVNKVTRIKAENKCVINEILIYTMFSLQQSYSDRSP